MADPVDAPLRHRPDIAAQQTKNYANEAGNNRDKPFPSKEGEILRHLDVLEPIVQISGDNPAENAGEHPHIELIVNRLQDRGQDEITDTAGQTGRAMVLLRKAYGNTDRKNQREVGKDRSSGVCEPFDVEQVGLSQTEQKSGNRKHRDREH